MEARMKNPANLLPGAVGGIQQVIKATHAAGVPEATLELVHLRASQINGCSPCAYAGMTNAKKAGWSDERLFSVATWRDAPYYTDAERAALQLAEKMTRLADRSGEAVPDELWEEIAEHYDEAQVAALITWIAMTNLFNRVNATIKEPAGVTW